MVTLTQGSSPGEEQEPRVTHAGVGTAMRGRGQTAATTPHSKGLGWTGCNMQGKQRKAESKKEGGR